jgi:hypothetical protein
MFETIFVIVSFIYLQETAISRRKGFSDVTLNVTRGPDSGLRVPKNDSIDASAFSRVYARLVGSDGASAQQFSPTNVIGPEALGSSASALKASMSSTSATQARATQLCSGREGHASSQ